MKQRHIIIAPHADDELIGCYSILEAGQVHTIFYPEEHIMVEANSLLRLFEIGKLSVINSHLSFQVLANKAKIKGGSIFFPDPVYEWHPEHKRWGMVGQELVRKGHSNVVFYSVNMTAPYIREIGDHVGKCQALNAMYSNKKSLWKYDHKYFLFEGHCQWLNNENLCHD